MRHRLILLLILVGLVTLFCVGRIAQSIGNNTGWLNTVATGWGFKVKPEITLTDALTGLYVIVTALGLFFAGYSLKIAGDTLRRSEKEQKATFVTNYILRFFTDDDLIDNFYELIYNYNDRIFNEIDLIYIKLKEKSPGQKPSHAELLIAVKAFQAFPYEDRDFFHPDNFQYTKVERRLDTVMGYFDLVGYFVENNLIEERELQRMLGYYIEVMNNRKVVQAYFDIIEEAYKNERENWPFVRVRKLCELVKKMGSDPDLDKNTEANHK